MFIIAVGYIHGAPGLRTTENPWSAWESFCSAVKHNQNVNIEYQGVLKANKDFAWGYAKYSKCDGFQNHFFRAK